MKVHKMQGLIIYEVAEVKWLELQLLPRCTLLAPGFHAASTDLVYTEVFSSMDQSVLKEQPPSFYILQFCHQS